MAGKKTALPRPETAAGKKKTRILLVDDHEMVRVGMYYLISGDPNLEVCGQVADAPSALRLVRTEKPDLAIVDISLQEGNGLELIKQMKASAPEVRALVVSMHEDELFAERALRAGARGYVNKHAPAKTILEAVHSVMEDRLFLSEKATNHILMQRARGEVAARSPMELLSDREMDIFRRIGQGQTIEEIAAQLHLSDKTVSTYRDRIRAKLQLDSASALVRHACLWLHEQT